MIRVSDHPNLNAALAACASTFGDRGGELALDKPTALASPAKYGHHGLSVRGEGNASPVGVPFATGDALTFARADKSELRNTLLRDFALLPSVARSAGWGLVLTKCVRSTVDNVDIGAAEAANMHHGGAWLNGFDDTTVNDCNIYARHKGVLVNGQPDQSFGADLVIGGGTKIANHRRTDMADALPGAVGVHLAGGQGGTYLDTVQAIYCGIGVLIDKAVAGVLNREVFLNPGTVVDSCIEDGIRVMPGAVGTLQATGVWSCSHGRGGGDGDGLSVEGNQHAIAVIEVTGGRYFNNLRDGIALNGGYAAISGPVLDNNRGYGLHVANGAVRGGADPVFGFGNGLGLVRNLSQSFRIGGAY